MYIHIFKSEEGDATKKKRPKITDTDNEDDDDKVEKKGEEGPQVDSQKVVDSSDDENIPIDNDRG